MDDISKIIKKRVLTENNYAAYFINGKTIRRRIIDGKPITELRWPEFYDVKITQYCPGKCSWCYMDSSDDVSVDECHKSKLHFKDVINKIDNYFGAMTKNQRPFQVAIGGGEPLLHPDFVEILKAFHNLDIVPNFTTNGWMITDEVLSATKQYCGGVAISCHPHLKDKWQKSAQLFIDNNIKLNFHLIISDKVSVDYFLDIFKEWKDKIEYFVLLKYMSQGRAKQIVTEEDYLFSKLKQLENIDKIAFGATFHDSLKQQKWLGLSLYEPEMFSKYLDMSNMQLYPSSFHL